MKIFHFSEYVLRSKKDRNENYFIVSSEFNAFLKDILSAVKKYRIFFTSDEYDSYFSL